MGGRAVTRAGRFSAARGEPVAGAGRWVCMIGLAVLLIGVLIGPLVDLDGVPLTNDAPAAVLSLPPALDADVADTSVPTPAEGQSPVAGTPRGMRWLRLATSAGRILRWIRRAEPPAAPETAEPTRPNRALALIADAFRPAGRAQP